MNCRDATALMSQAQDRGLALQERLALRVHVLMCSGCRHYGAQLGVLRQAARRLASGAVPGEPGNDHEAGDER